MKEGKGVCTLSERITANKYTYSTQFAGEKHSSGLFYAFTELLTSFWPHET